MAMLTALTALSFNNTCNTHHTHHTRHYRYNEFKLRIINERITEPATTVYRNGPLIDLCRGPHIPHTGMIKAFSVTKNSSSYWEGKADKEVLQRV